MSVFFGKIKKISEKFYYSDPVLNIYTNFPNLPIFENQKNFLFVFSNKSFPESDHYLKINDSICELDGKGSYDYPSSLNKYFDVVTSELFFFLVPIKEDAND